MCFFVFATCNSFKIIQFRCLWLCSICSTGDFRRLNLSVCEIVFCDWLKIFGYSKFAPIHYLSFWFLYFVDVFPLHVVIVVIQSCGRPSTISFLLCYVMSHVLLCNIIESCMLLIYVLFFIINFPKN